MAIPDFQTIMLPLLKATEDRAVHILRDVVERLAEEFALTEEERRELLPSGRQPTFNNRVGWARTYLTGAKEMEYLIVVEKTETGFSAYSPDVPGCVATGRTVAETEARMKEAIEFHIDGLKQEGLAVPQPSTKSAYVEITA